MQTPLPPDPPDLSMEQESHSWSVPRGSRSSMLSRQRLRMLQILATEKRATKRAISRLQKKEKEISERERKLKELANHLRGRMEKLRRLMRDFERQQGRLIPGRESP